MKVTVFGVLFVQVMMYFTGISGNGSVVGIKRLARSIKSSKMDFARQNCIGCKEDLGECSKKSFLRVKRYTEGLKCQPEPAIVKLHLPGPDYSVEPSMARVNRCSGYCKHGYYTCLPLKTSFVKVPVILTQHHGSGSSKCVEYEIEQHDECACDCEICRE